MHSGKDRGILPGPIRNQTFCSKSAQRLLCCLFFIIGQTTHWAVWRGTDKHGLKRFGLEGAFTEFLLELQSICISSRKQIVHLGWCIFLLWTLVLLKQPNMLKQFACWL